MKKTASASVKHRGSFVPCAVLSKIISHPMNRSIAIEEVRIPTSITIGYMIDSRGTGCGLIVTAHSAPRLVWLGRDIADPKSMPCDGCLETGNLYRVV